MISINRKDDYRDIDKWRKACNRQRKRYYRKTQNAENKGSRYTLKEIEMILDRKYSDLELSKLLGRSMQAIQGKRCRLRKESEVIKS